MATSGFNFRGKRQSDGSSDTSSAFAMKRDEINAKEGLVRPKPAENASSNGGFGGAASSPSVQTHNSAADTDATPDIAEDDAAENELPEHGGPETESHPGPDFLPPQTQDSQSDTTSQAKATENPADAAYERQAQKAADKVKNERLDGAPFDKHQGKGGVAGAAAAGGNRYANFLKSHPKGTIAGIVGLIGALVGLIIFIISIPFQMIHMAQILFDHNFGPGERIERQASRRVIARVFQARKVAEPTGAYKRTGHPIQDLIDNTRMDKFNNMLAKDDLKLEFSKDGRLTGIRNLKTNELVTDLSDASFMDRRKAVHNLVSERIAPWRVLKRVHYTKVMKFHARVLFRFWPKEKVSDIKKVLVERIRTGIPPEEIVNETSDPNAKGKGADEVDDVIKATKEEFSKSGNKVKAVRAGALKFQVKSAKVFGFTGIIAAICLVKDIADHAAQEGYVERTEQLMRNGNTVLTMAAQLRTGEYLDIDKFGQTMSMFSGDPSAPADSIDRKGWDQSAAAKRDSGEPVVTQETLKSGKPNPSYNPDLSEASNPDGFLLRKIMNKVDAIFALIPGANFTCKVFNSVFGIIIGGVELIAEILTTAGAADAAALAAKVAAMALLQIFVIPKVIAAGANLAITGTENAVDFFNNADAGLVLSANEYARSYGGDKLTDAQHKALTDAFEAEQIQIARENGWFYRSLDITNTGSIASRLMVKVPTTPSAVVASIISIPQTFVGSINSIFTGGPRSALADENDDNPYHFQYYGFTQEQFDKYKDPIANEKYLTDPVPGDAEGRSRLSILGDSSEYTPANGDDPNLSDLLHCFVNKFRTPEDLQSDPICKGIGAPTVGDTKGGTVPSGNGDDVIRDMYAAADLNASVNDDFLRYRMQLLYTHIMRGTFCASHDEDCFQGNGGGLASNGAGSQFRIATFNLLGANHSSDSNALARLHRALKIMRDNQFDVIGLQEVEDLQRDEIIKSGTEFDIFPDKTTKYSRTGGSRNSIIWRKDKFTKVDGGTKPFFYFNGDDEKYPYVRLQDNVTREVFVVFNTHDPTSSDSAGNQSKWRVKDAEIHLKDMEAMQADGTPTFTTGDFNSAYDLRHPEDNGLSRNELTYCILTSTGTINNSYDVFNHTTGHCPSTTDHISGSKIDHVYMTAGVEVTDWHKIDDHDVDFATDHPVMFADILIPGDGGASAPLTGNFTLPIQKYSLGVPFGERGSTWSLGYHTGQDFRAPEGRQLYAVTDGTVRFDNKGAYGIATYLHLADGSELLYAHQSKRFAGLTDGATVKAGQPIGYVGQTGHAFGAHLHFEYRPTGGGYETAKDPVAWLKSKGVAVPNSQ